MAHEIDRRKFLASAGSAALSLGAKRFRNSDGKTEGLHRMYVSSTGSDSADGNFAHPMRTLERALSATKAPKFHAGAAILLRAGVYELAETVRLTAEYPALLHIGAFENEEVVLSGGTRLQLLWKPYRDGIFFADMPRGTKTDQLFIDGKRQTMARYPNYDAEARYFNGTSADAFSAARAARWSKPSTGYIHALQQSLWGSLHYRITGKDAAGNVTYEGGWQIDRDQPMHKEYRFVENIFEELDAPGEWFLDEMRSRLYFYPPAGVDLRSARVEIVRLSQLLEVKGSEQRPVRGVTLHGITFRHTARTFMETREPLSRSDWRIYRGGGILLEGTEDVCIKDCFFDQMGGNAVFVSGYNRRMQMKACRVEDAGANGVCFVGRPEAVRNPLETYSATLSLEKLDMHLGPKSNAYPTDCLVEDCLIVATGRVEKQTAPVEIAMAKSITVRHCSMYGVPRAGINIGDGTWGGHRIEGCDVFDTVLETSDHGAFNSWGRDRWWHAKGVDADTVLDGPNKVLPTLDSVVPTMLTRTRWACEHGWDIDLDDGSTNYRIEQNLCLCGGIKLREGFFRVCENNVTVNNTLHPHVWPRDSHDVVRRNIFFVPYRPVRPKAWGESFDWNFLHRAGETTRPAKALQDLSGQDIHSLEGDAMFVNMQTGNFTVAKNSPTLQLGFENLEMQSYGVRVPRLRRIARVPDIARLLRVEPATLKVRHSSVAVVWMGASLRNISGLAEVSALGAAGEAGAVVESVTPGSAADDAGLMGSDLIVEVQGSAVKNVVGLLQHNATATAGTRLQVKVLRQQKMVALTLVVQE